ncbi:MAG: hypothetical protein IPH07_13275 [Deltaproteobacteria bacterium]|nr:hypothetical protein [Deltaproteobacteria bacterium]MBK8716952.1 hypothetical protein [Deltaproteobacteria bacterium]MBP7291269.1 hypothetical protein [Nannocystaceae bacterium]
MTRGVFATCCVLAALHGGCARDEARPAATPASNAHAPSEATAAPDGGSASVATTAAPDRQANPQPNPTTAPDDDAVRLVDVDTQAGPLAEQLAAASARAQREGRPIAVELWAGWCAPCKKLDRLIAGGALDEALRGSVLVRVDVDAFDGELDGLGFDAPQIPSLYRVDARGRPQGKPLSGGDWGRRAPEEIATAVHSLLRPPSP